MSTNLNYKQVANVERRTWDTEAYEKRAKERLKDSADTSDGGGGKNRKRKKSSSTTTSNHDDGNQGPNSFFVDNNDEGTKEEFIPAAPGAAKAHKSDRAFLKSRSNKVDVDSKIGSVEIVNPEAVATTKSKVDEPRAVKDSAITKTGIGWHCKVCDCFLRDSLTYLDHINGRKHQRNLGYSMKVERSTKDQVTSRLEALAREKEDASNKKKILIVGGGGGPNNDGGGEEEEDFFDVVKARDEEAKRRKEERARKRKERRKEKKAAAQQQPAAVEDKTAEAQTNEGEEGGEKEEVEEGGVDPALAAMMGFSGFGGGNKNH